MNSLKTGRSACPICSKTGAVYAQAQDIEYFTSDTVFDYCLCADCDVLYVDPCLSDKLDVIYPPNYYSFVDGNKNIVVRLKEWLDARAFRSLLSSTVGTDLKVLDVGGGTGWLAGLLRSIDSRISLTQIVDIDGGAQAAAERNGHRFFCGRIEDFQSEERYDVILMLNLIEHVADPVSVLTKARLLLTPSGRIYIKTPNFKALDAIIFRHRSWGGYHCPRHFVLFSAESFGLAAEKAGLSVEQMSYTQGAPFWAVSVLDTMRRIGLVSVTSQRPSIYHPLTPLLQAVGAAFDFARKSFSRLSQMQFILKSTR